jgi:NTE family protein
MAERALVLGGGGVAGIAWETGLVAGLTDAGVDLASADLVVGTSSGSVVAAQLASGVPLQQVLDVQLDPGSDLEPQIDVDVPRLWADMAAPGARDPRDRRAQRRARRVRPRLRRRAG